MVALTGNLSDGVSAATLAMDNAPTVINIAHVFAMVLLQAEQPAQRPRRSEGLTRPPAYRAAHGEDSAIAARNSCGGGCCPDPFPVQSLCRHALGPAGSKIPCWACAPVTPTYSDFVPNRLEGLDPALCRPGRLD